MKTHTFIAEGTYTDIVLVPQATGTGSEGYAQCKAGTCALNVRSVVTMGNAANLAISLKYADDATGTNAADFPVDVPLYVDGVRQTDAKAYTVADDTGNFVVDFCIDPGLIPDGKFVGLSYANSNAANLICGTVIQDTTDKPSV